MDIEDISDTRLIKRYDKIYDDIRAILPSNYKDKLDILLEYERELTLRETG